MHQRPHRSRTAPQHLGRLRFRQVVVEAQHQRGALPVRQRRERVRPSRRRANARTDASTRGRADAIAQPAAPASPAAGGTGNRSRRRDTGSRRDLVPSPTVGTRARTSPARRPARSSTEPIEQHRDPQHPAVLRRVELAERGPVVLRRRLGRQPARRPTSRSSSRPDTAAVSIGGSTPAEPVSLQTATGLASCAATCRRTGAGRRSAR